MPEMKSSSPADAKTVSAKAVQKPNPSLALNQQNETVLCAMNLYAEARGESTAGKYAVMNVVRNRKNAGCKAWGSSYKSVILAPWQFSWTNDLSCSNSQSTLYAKDSKAYEECYRIAAEVVSGGGSNPVGGADHYLTSNLVGKVNWAKSMNKSDGWVANVGSHSFFDLMKGDNKSALPAEGKPYKPVSDGGSAAQQPAPAETAETVYTVRRGDTLSSIASRFNVKGGYRKLAEYNGISNPNVISVGQKIKIPGTAKPAEKPVAPPAEAQKPVEQEKPVEKPQKPTGGETVVENPKQTESENDTGYVETSDAGINKIQKQHPDGITVVTFGDTKQDRFGYYGYTNNNNNREFKAQAISAADREMSVGQNLGMPEAMAANSMESIKTLANSVYNNIHQRYVAAKPQNAPADPEHLKIKNLALFYHGWQHSLQVPAGKIGMNDIQPFVNSIRGSLKQDVNVQLFACSTAGGDPGNFADSLAENLGGQANVFGHTNAGHVTENANARVYGALGNGRDMFDVLFPQDWIQKEAIRIWGKATSENVDYLTDRLANHYRRVCGLGGANGFDDSQKQAYKDQSSGSGFYKNYALMGQRMFLDPAGTAEMLHKGWREYAPQIAGNLRNYGALADTFNSISDPVIETESETQKPETQKPETQKPETVKPEIPKPETQKPETPKPETQKPQTQNAGNALQKFLVQHPEIKTCQDLVNIFYRMSNGTYDGAGRVAQQYGANINKLCANQAMRRSSAADYAATLPGAAAGNAETQPETPKPEAQTPEQQTQKPETQKPEVQKPEQGSSMEKHIRVTANSGLRLRDKPGSGASSAPGSKILSTMSMGTRLVATKEQDGWYLVTYNGIQGWCCAEYTKEYDPNTAGKWLWPSSERNITSPYGPRASFQCSNGQNTGSFHTGIDIADGGSAATIYASKAGVATKMGYCGYGNWIQIDHLDGTASRYAHMSSINFSGSKDVEAGEELGKEGATGNVTGPHLHFEIRIDGNHVNPLDHL